MTADDVPDEVIDFIARHAISNIRELQADEEAYKLEINDGKTGYRETPISRKMVEQMRMTKNVTSTRKNKPLIKKQKRTRRSWVKKAGAQLAEETGDDDWLKISGHDLRRTWATQTFYSLDTAHAKQIVMRWGGWEKEQTFRDNYLGRETDQMAARLMGESGLR